MSSYDRPYYHARSNVASTAFSKSSAIPKERKITFASEWYFYPLGVDVVIKRFEAFLAENGLSATCEWDDLTHSFKLRSNAELSSQGSAGFYEIIQGIIKQELKQGFKGKGPSYPNGDDDDDDGSDALRSSRVPNDEDDAVPEDELEELELDVSEALNSTLIRRLALWEKENQSIANQEVDNASTTSRSSITAHEVYPLPIKQYKFQFEWSSCAKRPMRLQKVAPDSVLEELRRLTGCDFSKQINQGILYIGSNNEENMNVAIHKLDNLTKNRKPFYCVNHFFYSEGHEKVKFALVPFSKVKKFYLETTILDNLHLIFNGGLDRTAGGLPSDWQTLADAVTVRCADWDQKNGVFDLIKKVEISIISDPGTDANFKEWVNFKYSAKGELWEDPRRYYSNQFPAAAHAPQLIPTPSQSGPKGSNASSPAQRSNSLSRRPNGAASRRLAPPTTPLHENGNIQKTLRIEQWAAGVNPNANGAPLEVTGESHVKKLKPLWDTYEEHDLDQILRTRKEKPAQASSALYSNISAMKRSTSTGFAQIGKRAEPPVSRQSTQMPRSVSHPQGFEPAVITEASHDAVPSALANITNTSLIDFETPSLIKVSRPVNPQFAQSSLETFKSRTILDDAVSRVGLPVIEPARQGENNTEWTPMQPVKHQSAVTDVDEPLISFSPPLQPVNNTAGTKLLPDLTLPEADTETERGTSAPSFLLASQNEYARNASSHLLDQIAQDALLAAQLQREENGSTPLDDALLAVQLQGEEARSNLAVNELLAAQYQCEVDHSYPAGDAELALQLQQEEEGQVRSAIAEKGATSSSETDAEKVQENDEVATRTYHQTMNQKAGRGRGRGNRQAKQPPRQNGAGRLPIPDPIQARAPAKNEQDSEDPASEFVSGITENFSGVMKAIRPFRGQIVLQAEFGRIIMRDFNPNIIFHKSGDKMFKDYDLQRLLLHPTEDGPFCSFTNVLTQLSADMQHLVKIKNRKGVQLWQPTSSWSVTYEFHFRDASIYDSPFFIVEVDGETFKTEVKVRRELGSIYCHGTIRHWDFRIAATGYESGTSVEGKYGAVRAAIEKTLYIPPGMKAPLLLWEMETALSNRFQLEELQVKRVLRYPSEDGSSTLNITEVQSLDIQGSAVPNNEQVSVFEGAPGHNNQPPTEKLGQWWEATISSPEADAAFEENKTLELGDEPTWTPDTLSKMHVASALYLPACEMLKQMDGVGFLNRNGIERATDEASNVVPKEKKSKVVSQDDFW